MILNSNDLFEQIGLIVDTKKSPQRSKQQNYSVYLEIQLSEGKHQLLQIKNYDQPHQIALLFCKKHKLNSLAVEIVQNKIRQAKYRQEIKNKSKITTQRKQTFTPIRNIMNKQQKQHIKTRIAVRNQTAQTKSINRSKSKYQKSPNQTNKVVNLHEQPTKKKSQTNIGNSLYNRAMMKNRIQQNQRQKHKSKKQKQQEQQLTFQPRINPVSAKIAQFRKQNPKDDREKQNKCQLLNKPKDKQQQIMKQCTFKPQINKVSVMIAQNGSSYKDQYDHFTTLYKQAQAKKHKLNQQIEKSQIKYFQPQVNNRYKAAIKQSFQQRLQRSLINKKKQLEDSQVITEQYSFKPKIGRAPKDSRVLKNKNSSAIWQHLYQQKLKKSHTVAAFVQQPKKTSLTTNFYYEHLVERKVIQVFESLDQDQDGLISPENINIQNLTKDQLVFLKPIFEEMQQLDAQLDYHEFKKAVMNLLKEVDPSVKGAFLHEKPKMQEKQSFQPLINQKSKQMITRVTTAHSIYDQLYEQGLKQLQKKQYKLQMQKAQQQQKQLEQCSFKPLLNNTSKYYIDKVLGKKINIKGEQQEQDIYF